MSTSHVTQALANSRFANAAVTQAADGSALVHWSWSNDERAALVEFLTAAGFCCRDRVWDILVTPSVAARPAQ